VSSATRWAISASSLASTLGRAGTGDQRSPSSTVRKAVAMVAASADFGMKPLAPCASARCTTPDSSRADTTTTGNCGCAARTCTRALKPCAPGMFRSISNRSASPSVSIIANIAATSAASTMRACGKARPTAPRKASRNSGWSSAIRIVVTRGASGCALRESINGSCAR